MTVPILYEDSDLLAVNKPAGLITHSDGRTEEPSVAEWVLAHYPELGGVGDPWVSPQGAVVLRPGIVHRLDRDTSGVLVLAKTQEAYTLLKQQFQGRSIEKLYRAFVYGHTEAARGRIEAEIVRVRATPPRWGVARAGEEKKHRSAVTEWRALSQGADRATGDRVAYLEARPITGRTHQIRVHLKHINHPVVSDPLYARGRPHLLGFSRTALHAFSLTLTLPSGERRAFTAPLPEDFIQALGDFVSADKNIAAK